MAFFGKLSTQASVQRSEARALRLDDRGKRRTTLIEPPKPLPRMRALKEPTTPDVMYDPQKLNEKHKARREQLKQQRHELRVMINYVQSELDATREAASAISMCADQVSESMSTPKASALPALKNSRPSSVRDAASVVACVAQPVSAPPPTAQSSSSAAPPSETKGSSRPLEDVRPLSRESSCSSTQARLTNGESASVRAPLARKGSIGQSSVVLKKPILDPLDIVPEHIIEGFRQEWRDMQ
ncbi:MAG: hypothetical protein SGPRY_002815, partial [Prymnesium sp.]